MNNESKVYFADKKIKHDFEKLKDSKTESRQLYESIRKAIRNLANKS